ncbi:MAG: SMP-30/gluconolactonase/LRE family protein [Nitrosomonas sp.]|nr:MAG: SMP-30/gluconolactonase/LRE family protein [Nitrosomonas sp.]
MRAIIALSIVILLAITTYLSFWPVPIAPVSWSAPTAPGYTGPHATNNRLGNLQFITLGSEEGPEHVVLARDGKLYASMSSGNIVRMNPDGTVLEVFVTTGGRVLGFDFDASGNLLAADALRGILKISPGGTTTALASITDEAVSYPNSLVIASNGKIYFTDSSARFAPSVWGGTFEASVLDIVEQSATGRVIEYDPDEDRVRIVARGLSFANGIALSQDEQTLFVNETGRYRVWKIAASADDLDVRVNSMQASVLFDNLPGYPDNLMRGLDGRIWLGFAKPRNAIIDWMSDKPFLRKMVLRLPRVLWPMPEAYGHVMAFTEDGIVITDLQDPAGAYPETTGVTETRDRIYVQSLHAKRLGWLSKDMIK